MQYPPSDWDPPAKAGKAADRTKREKLNLSPPASDALGRIRTELAENPAWVEPVTASVLIEFLCWHYERTKAGFKGFRPVTRRGRPTSVNFIENFRPANQRKAAGLSKTDVRVGQEPPDG